MSKFISGNVGILRKSDVFSLEMIKPDKLSKDNEYKIIATSYNKNEEYQIVTLESGNIFRDISDSFERMKKELEDIEE